MKPFKTLLLTLLLVNTNVALATGFIKGLSEEKVAELTEQREQAIKDDKALAEHANKLSSYLMETSRYENSMPSDIQAVESLIGKHEVFTESTFEEAKDFLEGMIDKYDAKDAKDLEAIFRKRINPEQATGLMLTVAFKSYQMTRSIKAMTERAKLFEDALVDAKNLAGEMKKLKADSMKEKPFPANNFTGEGDLADLQEQALNALVSGKIAKSDMLNVAITSGWTSGVFPITNIPFRTIRGSVLFKDIDDDGLCRFNGYTFISVNGGVLEYKAVRGGGDGYADCEKGASANGGIESSTGFFGNLAWFMLALINMIAGTVILKDKLASIKPIKNMIAQIHPYSVIVGLVAIGLGAWGFTMEFLSLNLLSNIVPQVSAVLVGTLLSARFLTSKKEEVGEHIAKIQPFTQSLGMAAIGIGLAHLILSGGLYFI